MLQITQPNVSFWLQVAEFLKDYVLFPFRDFNVVNAIDILVLSFLFYIVYKFIRDRHVGRTVIGLFLLILLYVVSDIFHMVAVNSILQNFYTVGIIALVVLFQPELRDVLEEFGATTSTNLKKITQRHLTDDEMILNMVDEICLAVYDLSSRKEGALIVLERMGRLNNQMSEGTPLDAVVTHKLLCNIFVNKSPLHDGAVIIRDCRIVKASSKSKTIAEVIPGHDGLGTRHRAAYRICEISDAVVVVVSEESGTISIASNKILQPGYDKGRDGDKVLNLRDDLFRILANKEISELETKADPISAKLKKKQEKQAKKAEKKKSDSEKGGEGDI